MDKQPQQESHVNFKTCQTIVNLKAPRKRSVLTLVGQNVAIFWLQRLMYSMFHAFVFNPGGVAGMVRSLETAQEQRAHFDAFNTSPTERRR